MSNQWQPIETAPRDGTQILGFAEWEGMIVCNWLDCSEIWEQSPKYAWAKNYDTVDMSYETFDPTHWMPLPLPPILRHNGVGEADMYSEKEYAQLMLPQSIPTSQVTDIHFLCVAAVLEPGQWVDWEVAFTYQGEACLGFLQACPAHPYLMHHHMIQNCCYE